MELPSPSESTPQKISSQPPSPQKDKEKNELLIPVLAPIPWPEQKLPSVDMWDLLATPPSQEEEHDNTSMNSTEEARVVSPNTAIAMLSSLDPDTNFRLPLDLLASTVNDSLNAVDENELGEDKFLIKKLREDMVTAVEAIFQMRRELASFRDEVRESMSSFDLKKAKKNRTLQNRCTFVNRRGEGCKGYICKVKGSRLCYAHHVLASASQYPDRRKKLY